MSIPTQISDLLDKLIADGNKLIEDSFAHRGGLRTLTDSDGLRRWSNELILFKSLCGAAIRPWSERLVHDGTVIVCSELTKPLSALETIRYAMDAGLLTSYEELVIAEAFADLFEQGRYLFSQGYFLAAGVIFRAVLEDRLRRLCEKHGCMPSKERPTISDLNVALYKHDPPVYDKGAMLHVAALGAVGNDAAHNKPELTMNDVKRLQDGMLDFLGRFER